MNTEQVTLQALVERRIAEQAVADPTVLGRLAADPDSVVRPILADVLGDDGELDLGSITTSVHVNTPAHLHFVVNLDAVDAEVAGFSLTDAPLGSVLSMGAIEVPSAGDESFKRSKDWRRCLSREGMCPSTKTQGCL